MDDDDRQHYCQALTTCGYALIAESSPAGQTLIASIEAAFDGLSLGQGMTWIQGEMRDNHESPEMIAEGGTLDRYGRWQDVPATLLGGFPSAGGYLDDEGLAFYMPALMRWEIRYGKYYPMGSPADVLDSKRRDDPHFFDRFSDLQRELFEQYRTYRNHMFHE